MIAERFFPSQPPVLNIGLLDQLREAQGNFVNLASLGRAPDVLARELQALVQFGFQIERTASSAAYRGHARRLCPDQIEHQLGTKLVGRRVAVWARVRSTNDLAIRASGSRSNDGLVILAEEQTEGRGRRGRAWLAPPCSSILMSVLLFPPRFPEAAVAAQESLGWLTALAAVATAEVVAQISPCAPTIKWPNDVRVAGRKIAGVLVERGTAGSCVLGIGLNVNSGLDSAPPELRARATSLALELGNELDRSQVAQALIQRIDAWYLNCLNRGPGELSAAWNARLEHRGAAVDILTPEGLERGRLIDLDLSAGATIRPLHDNAQPVTDRTIPATRILDLRQTDPETMPAITGTQHGGRKDVASPPREC